MFQGWTPDGQRMVVQTFSPSEIQLVLVDPTGTEDHIFVETLTLE